MIVPNFGLTTALAHRFWTCSNNNNNNNNNDHGHQNKNHNRNKHHDQNHIQQKQQ